MLLSFFFFFFTDPATTEIYTLSLHDALPIAAVAINTKIYIIGGADGSRLISPTYEYEDRKSTRLNSSHRCISYAVFCLKKKTTQEGTNVRQRNSRRAASRQQLARRPSVRRRP